MIKTKKVMEEVEVIESVTCNKCGDSCLSKDNPEVNVGLFARVKGHYWSHSLDDGTEYKFDLCEDCLKALFETFSVPVETREYPLNEG